MRYYIDTEYYDNQLISIGVVCEDGRDYYAENSECNYANFSNWVNDNIVTQLTGPQKTLVEIAQDLDDFCIDPEFWAYMDTSHFHFFVSLFDGEWNEQWPFYCFDLFQLKHHLGNPDLPKQQTRGHHALNDAEWNLEVWNFLENYARQLSE